MCFIIFFKDTIFKKFVNNFASFKTQVDNINDPSNNECVGLLKTNFQSVIVICKRFWGWTSWWPRLKIQK